MAGQTPRFGFNYFGGSVSGTPNDDGQKFFGVDRLTLDRLLSAVENHNHHHRPVEAAPPFPPTAALQVAGGRLQGGFTYYYRFSIIDRFGNESIASPEVAIETPALLPRPAMPSASSTEGGGNLAPGMYYYALTALRGAEETPIGPANLIQLLAGWTAVTLALPEFGEADAFRVWRMGANEPGYTKIGLVNRAAGATFVDAGQVPADPCACDPGAMPPPANTGTTSYAVDVTLPLDADLETARSWRLYRSMVAGVYPTSALVQEVVDREDEWDENSPLVRTYRDIGGVALSGKPLDRDINMRFQPYTFDVVDDLPPLAGYPLGYPLLCNGTFYVSGQSTWEVVGGGGGGGMSGVMTSPNGSRFILTVDNTGALVTTPTTFPGPPPMPTNFKFDGGA